MFNTGVNSYFGILSPDLEIFFRRIVYNAPENSIQKAAPVGAALHETNGPVWAISAVS